jgi:ElaB/YqjD/DUF883 family membrane-anchored ribosome-binding protein
MYKNAKHKHFQSDYDLEADLEKIKNAFAETASDLKGRTGEIFHDSYEGVKDRSSQMRDQVADYTAEKPLKSLGIAFAVGLALGYFIHK